MAVAGAKSSRIDGNWRRMDDLDLSQYCFKVAGVNWEMR